MYVGIQYVAIKYVLQYLNVYSMSVQYTNI